MLYTNMEAKKEITPGIYKHYKNGKEYKVLFCGRDSETKKDVVIYQAMYGDKEIWVRPYEMFTAMVEKEGKQVPRFEFINEAEDDSKNFEDKYKRALADYQNLQKQMSKERFEFVKYANEQLLCEILPVYDNLKMAILHSDSENGNWVEGVKHVANQFKSILNGIGVEEIKTVGEKFDHNLMEAMENVPTEKKDEDNIVSKELRPGYKLHDKAFIPAKVAVYKLNK